MTHQSPFFDGFTYLGEKTYSCGGQTHSVHEYCHQKTGMDFVLISEGTYWVCGDGSEGEVRLHEYLIGKYTVTQEIYENITGENPSKLKGAKRPLEMINWFEAMEFCQKVGLALPTEVEWEVACRAGTKSAYYWGETMIDSYCWYKSNSGNETHPVGQKEPNAYGIYDMSGNVDEWCFDWCYVDYPTSKDNPTGPSDGYGRVIRGGSYSSNAGFCTSGRRYYHGPDYNLPDFGFRCAFRPGTLGKEKN